LRDVMCARAKHCGGESNSVYREYDKCISTWNETWCALTTCIIDENLFSQCKAELEADPNCVLDPDALFTKTCWKVFDNMTCSEN
jgi:hypothetical protein